MANAFEANKTNTKIHTRMAVDVRIMMAHNTINDVLTRTNEPSEEELPVGVATGTD
jgi:hypothetical protein